MMYVYICMRAISPLSRQVKGMTGACNAEASSSEVECCQASCPAARGSAAVVLHCIWRSRRLWVNVRLHVINEVGGILTATHFEHWGQEVDALVINPFPDRRIEWHFILRWRRC